MNDLVLTEIGRSLYQESDELIQSLLEVEQAPCPLVHRFGPGMYIREAHYPKGIVVIGHEHKLPHLNIFVKGRLKMLNADGTVTDMVAPLTFIGKPGRKFAYMVEDVTWQNVWATDKTDVDTVEAEIYNMPEYWHGRMGIKALTAPDGIDEPTPIIPQGWECCVIRRGVDGVRTVFATAPIPAGEPIVPLSIVEKFVRRSTTPNAEIQTGADGKRYLVSTQQLRGCFGGDHGTEVTIQEDQKCLEQ